MQMHGSRRSGDNEIASHRGRIELDIEHRMQFDDIGGDSVLMVKKIEEANARYLHRNIGSLEGRTHRELCVKLSPRIRDMRSEGAARIDARWRGNLRDHGIPLVVLQYKVVVGVRLALEVR
jgi:hypothetical protein